MDFSHASHDIESFEIDELPGLIIRHGQYKLALSIKFSCQRVLRLQDGEQFGMEGISNHVYIEPEEFSSHNKMHEIIDQTVRTWQICNCRRESVIQNVIQRAQEIAERLSSNHSVIFLDVKAKVVYSENLIHEYSRMYNEILQQSIEEDNDCNMIPATDSSIKSLEMKKLDDENNDYESCSICLDKFYKGIVTTCMPCLHMFHSNCITQWLKMSHYCPVCRFEMPID
ncbi:E3 ubiquitin-protein ligase SGR9, amyloplastic-like [Olea europaea var. sylvestris]|uniref:E3 ubiquitin-protein ligase SGR9, amyloplastic-like n=1 Tax=Olea europaea var. sylvestris TaxID=158386 RepID=UPI000C1D0D9A|nr:E3 ubiquitin-protein ligase SGR9, amyloplastic-like [Olea europaea var. sylvestris]